MSAMGEFHHELTSAGIDPRTYEFDQVRGGGYIPNTDSAPTAATTANQQAGFSAPNQEPGRPAFFVASPGSCLMPTKRRSSHTKHPVDTLLETGQRTFGWLAAIGAAYLAARAFIPFLWHLVTGARF